MPPPESSTSIFGWSALDAGFLVVLVVLLVLSAFFSGSETALFGMSEAQRAWVRGRKTAAARAVEALLHDPRMLLITVLLGNMSVNVLYFVISSVLMMRSTIPAGGRIVLALVSLLAIVLFGEVLPKIAANSRPAAYASFTAPILLTLHRALAPVRTVLDRLVVTPLSRLTAPGEAPPRLDAGELRALIGMSSRQGVIDPEEQQVLLDVLELGQMKVREVMMPRVKMHAIPITASRDEITDIARSTRLTKLPVFEDDVDRIVGVLHVKRYLLDAGEGDASVARAMTPPRFVPQVATVEQLLEHFRRTHTQSAIVVDEYGGTAGLVSIEDAVEELVGEIVGADETGDDVMRPMGPGRWQVHGDASVREWVAVLGLESVPPRVTTLGGLITDRLGRAAEPGDHVRLGDVLLEVAEVEASHIVSVVITDVRGDDDVTDEEETR